MSSRLRNGETGRRTHYTHMQTLLGDFFLAFCLAKGIPPLWAHPRLTRWIRAYCSGQQPWDGLAGTWRAMQHCPSGRSVLAGGSGSTAAYAAHLRAPRRMHACCSALPGCCSQTARLDKSQRPPGLPSLSLGPGIIRRAWKKFSLSSRLRSGETGRRTHYTHVLFRDLLGQGYSAFI